MSNEKQPWEGLIDFNNLPDMTPYAASKLYNKMLNTHVRAQLFYVLYDRLIREGHETNGKPTAYKDERGRNMFVGTYVRWLLYNEPFKLYTKEHTATVVNYWYEYEPTGE